MYFEDLTAYNYEPRTDDPDYYENMLNVGWLDPSQPFQTGKVSQDALNRLMQLAETPVREMLGFQYCEFCDGEDDGSVEFFDHHPKGNCEIRVTSKSGATYAAPILICHYVSAHQYLPPQEFLDALVEP